jgi:hypothetical protein
MFLYGIGYKSTNKQRNLMRKRKINEYIIDETAVKVGSELIWIWVVIEPIDKEIPFNQHIKRTKYVCS